MRTIRIVAECPITADAQQRPRWQRNLTTDGTGCAIDGRNRKCITLKIKVIAQKHANGRLQRAILSGCRHIVHCVRRIVPAIEKQCIAIVKRNSFDRFQRICLTIAGKVPAAPPPGRTIAKRIERTGKMQRIEATPAEIEILARIVMKPIIAPPAMQHIVTCAARQHIIPAPTEQQVIAATAKQRVIAIISEENIMAAAAKQRIIPITADENIVATATIKRVIPAPAIQNVMITGAAAIRVGCRQVAPHARTVAIAINDIIARMTFYFVASIRTDNQIALRSAIYMIIPKQKTPNHNAIPFGQMHGQSRL